MNRRTGLRRLFVLGALSVCTGIVVCFGDIVVRETRVGPMPTDFRQLALTADGSHAALIGMAGSRPAVYIDGNAGPSEGLAGFADQEKEIASAAAPNRRRGEAQQKGARGNSSCACGIAAASAAA